MDGFINLYKPANFTSHDALNIVRRFFRGTKIGHGGTLDPDATGVLPVCIGKGTKLQDLVMGGDKAYEADVIFGLDSLSLDRGSEVTVTDDAFVLDRDQLEQVLERFIGKQMQYPPVVSAIKQNGVPLYKRARRGETVETEPRAIVIYSLELENVWADEPFPRIRIAVRCSKGTYIRSLGRDIGEAMGTTAVIDRLNRTASGMFSLENSVTLDEIRKYCERKDYSFLIPMDAAVAELPRFDVRDGAEWKAVLDGNALPVKDRKDGDVSVFDPCGKLMAVGKIEDGYLKPRKILWEHRKRKGPMKTVRNLSEIDFPEGSAVVIGNFDGVHLGHRFLIEQCVKDAERKGLSSVVLTFDPHPKEYFGANDHFYLQSLRKKETILDELGVDLLVNLPFDKEMANMEPQLFFDELLRKQLQVKSVYVGDDFSYGRGAMGTAESLRKQGEEYGIEVSVIPRLTFGGEIISSSRIKAALLAGNIPEASRLLGQPYTVSGVVQHGREIGRSIGFPTANICFEEGILIPRSGVYISRVRCGGKKYEGVACIGRRPTVEEGQRVNLEVHLLDFDADLYGKEISVTLISFLRGEKKFDSLEELKSAIALDTEKTKKFFQKRRSNPCN
ncbi:MAG: bifunctional riboflavin kinase/FAD synthetase [Clostridia bacterium]